MIVVPHATPSFFDVLTGGGRGQGWIELRHRTGGGMRSRFFPAAGNSARLFDAIARLSASCDVYIGVALRDAKRGDKQSVGESWTLWAECDGPKALGRVTSFQLPPTLLVASGTPGNVHAYWALDRCVDALEAEATNRRLAAAVGGDPVCFDAGRILRPPGSLNHKHSTPLPVRQIGTVLPFTYTFDELSAMLPVLPRPAEPAAVRVPDDDALLAIAPEVYVPALTGATIGRDHKARCPFHEDRTPSLHVYPTAERGWFCFGCGRGGSIYDLAAELWGLDTRGAEFSVIKRRLQATITSRSTPRRWE